ALLSQRAAGFEHTLLVSRGKPSIGVVTTASGSDLAADACPPPCYREARTPLPPTLPRGTPFTSLLPEPPPTCPTPGISH
ncbi:hypothetical protein NHX12_029295, partial [Muraenolepis orangiensis]